MKRVRQAAAGDALALHVPALDELWYRERLLADPDTMRYNRGYHLNVPGYHDDTGCIDFPQSQWERCLGASECTDQSLDPSTSCPRGCPAT